MSMMAAQPAPIRRRYAALAEAGLESLPAAERWRAQALVSLTRGGVLDTDLGQALSYCIEATDLALEHVPELAVAALATLAYAHYLAGDAALARSTADQALNRPEAAQRPHGVVYAHAVHALLECDAGRLPGRGEGSAPRDRPRPRAGDQRHLVRRNRPPRTGRGAAGGRPPAGRRTRTQPRSHPSAGGRASPRHCALTDSARPRTQLRAANSRLPHQISMPSTSS